MALMESCTPIRFDWGQRMVHGRPVPLVRGVMDADVRTGALHFSVSENGSLTYLLGTSGEVGTLVWANANAKGAREELPVKPLSYGSPRVSPDRARIALDVGSGAAVDIHVYDLRRDHLTRLTSDGSSRFPLWTPDGERICVLL